MSKKTFYFDIGDTPVSVTYAWEDKCSMVEERDTRMLNIKMNEIIRDEIKEIIWDFFSGEKYRIIGGQDFEGVANDIMDYLANMFDEQLLNIRKWKEATDESKE
jgi:hypothetical protein